MFCTFVKTPRTWERYKKPPGLIRFHSTNSELSPSVAYLYRKMDTCYLEQPYSGIWELEASVLDAIAADL